MDDSPLTCTSEQLYGVVSGQNRGWLMLSLSNPAITEDHIVALLRNPLITPEIIHSVYERYDWSTSNKVQFGIVNCAKTPYTLAIRLLPNLFWNDLLRIAVNYRLTPRLRRSAENHLRDKVSNLTLGERITLARTAPRPVINLLRTAKEKEVIAALLRNPNLIEDDILLMINNEMTPPHVLQAIGSDHKWAPRYSVRLALCQNQRTPLPVVLASLSKLRKPDLKAVASSPATPELVRRSASRILSGNY
jgi:hypothetical protein